MSNAIPARSAHGVFYWWFVGWWWAPIKWVGRVLLWVFLLPLGIWRTVHNTRKNDRLRERRGAIKANR